MSNIELYRVGGMAMARGARVAHVSLGQSIDTVSIIGLKPTVEDLAAMGVHDCARVDHCPGYCEAYFPRRVRSALLAQLREAFDVVVDRRCITSYRLEWEFIVALIEWGCGPLPTLAELNARNAASRETEVVR